MPAFFSRPRVQALGVAIGLVAALGGVAFITRVAGADPSESAASVTSTSFRAADTTTSAPPSTTTTSAPVATTTSTAVPKPVVTTTAPVPKAPTPASSCSFATRIVAGGIGSDPFVYDQLVIEIRNPAWVDAAVRVAVTADRPATMTPPFAHPDENPRKRLVAADGAGLAQYIVAVDPMMQGGKFSVHPSVASNNGSARTVDSCPVYSFTLDYAGPSGLPGGAGASHATQARPA